MKKKIILTLGPSTLKVNTLRKLKNYKISLFRINLSHTSVKDLPKILSKLQKEKISPICIDTEGAQIRTYGVKKQLYRKGQKVLITNSKNKINSKNIINLYPNIPLEDLKINTEVLIGFENLKIKVISSNEKIAKAVVIENGLIENNKGVHIINREVSLKPLTEKDIQAIKIAKQFKIKNFALSFANNLNSIKEIRKYISKKDNLISKIETRVGFNNRKQIINNSDVILIDRGDLSRYISVDKIPIAQKILSKNCLRKKTQLFIATNLLETMIHSKNPTRAESNDIFNSLSDGADGLVLAAETAIGKYPIECINFLNKCIKSFLYSGKKKKINNLFN